MRGIILLFPLILVSCVSTGRIAKSPDADADALPAEYAIQGVFLPKSQYDYTTAKYSLWKMLEVLSQVCRLDSSFLSYAKQYNVGKISDIPAEEAIPRVSVFQLRECQALVLPTLISHDIPVLCEWYPKGAPKDNGFALFYRYKLVHCPSSMGAATLDKDNECVYLEHNLDYPGRIVRQLSKSRVDMNENPLSADLLSLEEKRAYDAIYKPNVAERHNYYDWMYIDNLYVVLPPSYDTDRLSKLIEKGIADRDFSYKMPKIVRLFSAEK